MDKKTKRGGMGFLSTLTLIFVVLKLLGLIDWPWLWVLSPIWIPVLLIAAVFGVILVAGRIKKGRW
ncbi:MAG TPA: hypothetical protein IAB55_01365 [Candidatus Merdivicinus faecavium]|nr:hypothetical protein [Candidatus Merdivicinus faecavium]